MKNIVFACCAVTALALCSSVQAAPPRPMSVLVTETESAAESIQPVASSPSDVTLQPAPVLTADQGTVSIPEPIVMEAGEAPAASQYRSAPAHSPSPKRSSKKKNESVFDKIREFERKKNAWLRRTFLGR